MECNILLDAMINFKVYKNRKEWDDFVENIEVLDDTENDSIIKVTMNPPILYKRVFIVRQKF